MQDARYSIGWFVWPKDDVLIQGPAKRYPPTTMKEFMKVRRKHPIKHGHGCTAKMFCRLDRIVTGESL